MSKKIIDFPMLRLLVRFGVTNHCADCANREKCWHGEGIADCPIWQGLEDVEESVNEMIKAGIEDIKAGRTRTLDPSEYEATDEKTDQKGGEVMSMSTQEASITISANVIKQDLEGKTDLEDIITTAMDSALKERCTWMIGDEGGKFKAAVCAIYLVVDDDKKEIIKREMDMLKSLSAAMSGVPVNFGALFDRDEGEIDEMIGLMKHWRKAVDRKKKKGLEVK